MSIGQNMDSKFNFKINHSLIEKLPEDHFGTVTKNVVNNLTNGKCSCVYGLPGYGMEFFAKHIVFLLQKKFPKNSVYLINVAQDSDRADFLANTKVENFIKNNKLIIVLAEVTTPKYKKFYQRLNSLRWLAKDNFTVLTVTDHTMYSRYEEYLSIGPDIFQPIYHVEPFTFEGTKRIIELNNEEYNWDIPGRYFSRIYELSGGIPALTKYICMALYEEGYSLLDEPAMLIEIQPLKKRISDLADLIPLLTIQQQKHFGLIDETGSVWPEILRLYLENIEFDDKTLFLPHLTKNEKRVLYYMIRSQNKVLDKDRISILLNQDLDSYSEWAIYKTMERIRKKVDGYFSIKTVKGRGWILEVSYPGTAIEANGGYF